MPKFKLFACLTKSDRMSGSRKPNLSDPDQSQALAEHGILWDQPKSQAPKYRGLGNWIVGLQLWIPKTYETLFPCLSKMFQLLPLWILRCQATKARRLGKKANSSSNKTKQGIMLLYAVMAFDSGLRITAVPCTVPMDATRDTMAKGCRKA